jgi:hypothetical protein
MTDDRRTTTTKNDNAVPSRQKNNNNNSLNGQRCAMPVRGDIVVIVKGRNIGRTGMYIKNVAFTSCMVLLENSPRPQRFLRTSVALAPTAAPPTPAAAPPTPVATAVLLASPAQEHTQETDDSFRQRRSQEVDTLFRQLNLIMNSLDEMHDRLKDLMLQET